MTKYVTDKVNQESFLSGGQACIGFLAKWIIYE